MMNINIANGEKTISSISVNKVMLAIAGLTLVESLRNRLPWVVGLFLLLGWLLALFLADVAVTEAAMVQSSIVGAFYRFVAVFLVSVTVISGSAREFDDRLVEMILSLAIPRATYFFGKLFGYGFVALITAMVFAAALIPLVPMEQVLMWGISLWCELLIMVAMGIMLVLTLVHVATALTAAIGLYLLARSMDALLLISTGPFAEHGSFTVTVASKVLLFLSWLLPDLGNYTSGAWLAYHSGEWLHMGGIVMESLVTIFFICAAGLFDLYRKNF